MKFNEYDVVMVLKDYPEYQIKRGDVGVVIMIHEDSNFTYEVEFSNENGKSKSSFAIPKIELELVL